jgi:hypothetical protein
MVSWVNLQNILPIDVPDFISKCTEADTELLYNPDLTKELNNYKKILLGTKSTIEILIDDLSSLLENPDLQKTAYDGYLFDLLKKDISGYYAILDEKQERLIEAHDGEETSGVGRTLAFKNILVVALHGIIYGSLYKASKEYNNLDDEFIIKDKKTKRKIITTAESTETEEEEIDVDRKEKKDLNAFFRILFHVLSMKLSGMGGLERRRGTSSKGYQATNWRSLYTNKGKEQVAETYKEETGGEIKDEILKEEDLFAEETGGEDEQSTENNK